MNMSPIYRSARGKFIANHSGQAVAEFALGVTLLLFLVCASIDFGRMLNDVQVMAELTRQGSMLSSRGDSLTQAITAVVNGESALDLVNNGEVIITSVTNENNVYTITGQLSSTTTGQTKLSQTSKVGTGVGATATVPAAAAGILQVGQTIFVTEIFYSFSPITPIGTLTGVVMPSQLYDAAYF